VTELQIFAVDLPLRVRFRHAAAQRRSSESVFVRLHLDDGVDGWGESLPRPYVTGETVEGAVELLRDRVAPALVGEHFASLGDVVAFLAECDGAAPDAWVPRDCPQAAAWCAIDLALLDAFARREGRPALAALTDGRSTGRASVRSPRYSGVASADTGPKALTTLLKMRAFGLRELKIKVDAERAVAAVRTARRTLGSRADLRVDANMAWSAADAGGFVEQLMELGVHWFEQPVGADDLTTMARLVERSGADIVADESFTTRSSLESLLAARAVTGVNARISKCGGLIATQARCHEAFEAGLLLQVGCHVGESSLLSSAQLALLAALAAHGIPVRYAEGSFGRHLLPDEPVAPTLQLRRGGRLPARPAGDGFGVRVDPAAVALRAAATATIT